MIKLSEIDAQELKKALIDARNLKKIKNKDVAIEMGIKPAWASDLFNKLGTLQTQRFLELIKVLDGEVWLDLKLPGEVSPVEFFDFVELVLDQYHFNAIDAGAAMRKIKRKLKS